ncbi:MAG TPA: FAD/NAD(P)-binding oxidoreductase, partial [Firmicutes bacterium]|nr:FAD/NAD(P)-binding oxidoreductase [Bacillota bacterium]
KAMKKRTRAGFGKCQGGFCQAKVLSLLASYQKVSLDKINYGKPHSPILLGKAKKGISE